ncbi:alpha-1,4-glucan--maltose-1-phosphate maltosyltransferase [Bordetella bronchiseptica]|uniref:alpha-1,4-glucan--maltose-1-phosphate maltosyltransferase n=1 Tax=Bordetella bronchiseptica TaxID=518 RepID=UPI000460F995|nr:alpha-1,4-glucan--maltose-1-phosphate maltosyltransferase [Bordetella bronchiseptica]KDD13407.1 PF11896 domain protein [Bordetella bronchiseptica MBORD707]
MVRRAAARLDRDAELLAFHAAAIALARGARASPYAAWQALCTRLRRCGFNAVCLTPPWQCRDDIQGAPTDVDHADARWGGGAMDATLARLAREAAAQGLTLLLDLEPDRVARDAAPRTAQAQWLESPADEPAGDPRQPVARHGVRYVRGRPAPAAFLQAWQSRLAGWLDAGVAGFRCTAPQRLDPSDWRALFEPLRASRPALRLLAWTAGLTPAQSAALAGVGFDGVFGSIPWWSPDATWLDAESQRLREIAPLLAAPLAPAGGTPLAPASAAAHAALRALWVAALWGDGLLVGSELQRMMPAVARVLRWRRQAAPRGRPVLLCGRDGWATLIIRPGPSGTSHVLALDPQAAHEPRVDWSAGAALLPAGAPRHLADPVEHGALYRVAAERPVRAAAGALLPGPPSACDRDARVVFEHIAPSVAHGSLAAKALAHVPVEVGVDLISDGHEQLAGELQWRAADQAGWHGVALAAGDNDRWHARFAPRRVGLHEFRVCAWRDTWLTFCRELRLKHEADQDIALDLAEGAAHLRAALARRQARGDARRAPIEAALSMLDGGPAPADAVAALLRDGLAQAMRALAARPFMHTSASRPLWVDRAAAGHGSWYELFPRSLAAAAGAHGSFDDVIARLPALRAMGFDVLYLPPIHPIGQSQRKGRNNALQAAADDPGSPYAIGSPDGGHDAIHPQLGTRADFARLVQAAAAHGMEVALDFAIQCSPDHPWLQHHPDWFEHRADGSIRHAENPPKRYEDIVNVSFYDQASGRPRRALWRALRDVLLYWIDAGVRIFRVDNPHTKPLPFWQWLIADVHARHPDVVFLSEAFTRPRMMYRLAKLGFTQSYTYFTWRNTRHELDSYLRELSRPPVCEWFRPNFFVNTPDINPYFLQASGRAGFLIRAALAAAGSGLWGMYSGFELCEAQPVPGKEEYLDSEKYQLRQRDWHAPGNVTAEIAALNRIRRANPALHSHLGYVPLHCANEQVLTFCKATPNRASVVLVAVSLDPWTPQSVRVALPRWLFGLDDSADLHGEDLLDGARASWREAALDLQLTPQRPYRLWRLWSRPLSS